MMTKCDEVVQNIAKAMLQSGMVAEVVAFGEGMVGSCVPLFITQPEDTEKIITTANYPSSLAKLVAQYEDKNKKIGLVLRPCDAKAVIELVKRQQLKRENLYLIGLECYGIPRMRIESPGVYIFVDQKQIDGKLEPLDESILRPSCRRCDYPVATVADVSVRIEPDGACIATALTDKGKAVLAAAGIPNEKPESDLAKMKERAARWREKEFGELKKMTPRERLNYWVSVLDGCIKCYGCRNACPICFCKECYLDPGGGVVERGEFPPERLYHIGRLIHVGDACVNCGLCEATCPMGLHISKLYHLMTEELGELFDYEPGLDIEALPPVSSVPEADLTSTGVNLD